MPYHYRVQKVGSGVAGDPYRDPHAEDVDVSPDEYTTHHTEARAIVASAVEIPAYEDADGVERFDPDGGEFPAPGGADGGEFACDECGDAFDSQQALNGHRQVH